MFYHEEKTEIVNSPRWFNVYIFSTVCQSSLAVLEESGSAEWAVGNVCSLGAPSSTYGAFGLLEMGRCQFIFLFKYESKSSLDNWMLNLQKYLY